MSGPIGIFFGMVQITTAIILILKAGSLGLPTNFVYFLSILLIVSSILDIT
jgi:hypothetical protein